MGLKYISYDQYLKQYYPQDAIDKFDCGLESFNDFLKYHISEWKDNYSGITYFLIDEDETKSNVSIYAFATISTIGLLSKINKKQKYISGIEIRLFAIHKRFRGKSDQNNNKYSHIFFALLLQDLWLMAVTKISFKMIFLQANNLGKQLYQGFGFINVENYITLLDDDKLEVDDCCPMICLISDELMYQAFSK